MNDPTITNPITLYGIITVLGGVIGYLYRELRRADRERVSDLKEYTTKATGLFDTYNKQQELWLEKLLKK